MRVVFRIGYRVGSAWWFITRPSPNGSKVVVRRGEQLLFIRLTYGQRDIWDLPGGTAAEEETPEQTAARELFEEVGLAGELRLLGVWSGDGAARRATLHAFETEVAAGAEPVLDDVEVAEARWFDQDDLPDRITPVGKKILKVALNA